MNKVYCLSVCLIFILNVLCGQEYNFRQYSIEQNLSQSQVLDIEQDINGLMWIGTYGGGISVCDGQNTIYITLKDGLPNYSIISLFKDHNNNIWIGTVKGLCIYDGHKIVHPDINKQLSNYVIWDIDEDKNGNIWLGTEIGVWKYSNNEFSFFKNQYNSTSHIYAILVDSDNNLWFSTNIGSIYKFDGKKIQNHSIDSIAHLPVEAIFEDSRRNIWIGTENGLYKLSENKINHYSTSNGMSDNHITAINEDNYGNLWLGTENNGIMFFDGKKFVSIKNGQGLLADKIFKIFKDKNGDIWIATDGAGAMLFNNFMFSHIRFQNLSQRVYITTILTTPEIKYFGTDAFGLIIYEGKDKYKILNKNFGLADNAIHRIIRTNNNEIWIATNNGLNKILNQKITSFNTRNGLPGNEVSSLLYAKDGKLWIGTFGAGVCYYKDGKFISYNESDGLASKNIWDIKQNRKGEIYFATSKGLTLFNENKFKSFYKSDGLPEENLISLAIDIWDNCWIGGQGISRFDGQKFINYNTTNGLNSDIVYSLIFDSKNNLVVGTEKGIDIIKINKQGEILDIEHYGKKEGFTGIETNNNAIFNDDEGKTWIGTINGVTIYDPWQKKDNNKTLDVIIKNIRFIYSDTTISQYYDSIPAWTHLPYNLKLPYSKNNIEIEFIGLNYQNPDNIKYKYILEGFDKEWSAITSKNTAHFINLPSGKFTFKVIAALNNKNWTEKPASYSFEILKPFWKNTWFIILSSILFITGIWVLIYIQTRNINKKRQLLELKVEKRTLELRKQKNALEKALRTNDEQRKKLEKANIEIQNSAKLKEQFLANTSHEIRTPLNIIMGFTNLLYNTTLNQKQLEYLNNIKNAGNNLLVIINDILDFSKMEANKLQIENINFDFNQFIISFISMMSISASEKKIEIKYHVDKRIPQFIIGDPVRLNQILTNLVRNSIKFSNENGFIKIDVDLIKETNNTVVLYFQIIDKGIGIPPDQTEKIFDCFNQVSNETTRKFGGTGLGLSITKRLIKLMNGKIGVLSEPEKGSTFYFMLEFQKGEKTLTHKDVKTYSDIAFINNIKILLVEDNPANAVLASDTIQQFNPSITVDIAENGIIAIEKIKKTKYDCIIMDIQMPEMDGYEATRTIRNKLESPINTIPILGMSAHAMQNEKEKCIQLGMNDYISKPFDPYDLMKKLNKLLNKNIENELPDLNYQKINQDLAVKNIDLSILAKTYRNDLKKIQKILMIYVKDIPRQINEMELSINNGQWQQAKVIAHSLKTSFKYLGIEQAHCLAKTIEANISENNFTFINNHLAIIKNQWELALNEIHEIIPRIK